MQTFEKKDVSNSIMLLLTSESFIKLSRSITICSIQSLCHDDDSCSRTHFRETCRFRGINVMIEMVSETCDGFNIAAFALCKSLFRRGKEEPGKTFPLITLADASSCLRGSNARSSTPLHTHEYHLVAFTARVNVYTRGKLHLYNTYEAADTFFPKIYLIFAT